MLSSRRVSFWSAAFSSSNVWSSREPPRPNRVLERKLSLNSTRRFLSSTCVLGLARALRFTLLRSVAFRALIEFIFALLSAKSVVLALVGARCRSFFLVHLHATNRLSSHITHPP